MFYKNITEKFRRIVSEDPVYFYVYKEKIQGVFYAQKAPRVVPCMRSFPPHRKKAAHTALAAYAFKIFDFNKLLSFLRIQGPTV